MSIRKIKAILMMCILCMGIYSCKHENIPLTETVTDASYTGEWNGTTATTRALTSVNTIVQTSVPLTEIMSLRQQDGKDTFNFKDPVTGLNIPGRQGTWSVIRVNNSGDQTLNGARVLRLGIITAPTRITYSTYTIQGVESKTLVLYDGAGKTLTYTK